MNASDRPLLIGLLAACSLLLPASLSAAVDGWLHWRGPQQNGTSMEKNLPADVALEGPLHLWTADLAGQSTATIADGRLYILGFAGEGPDMQELIACLDAETGEKIWEHRFNDFLSDIIYNRYSTGSPTIDPETGNVYMQGSQGLFVAFDRDGKILWKTSMMETYGRMTFPNGRTASPVVDRDLVITHHITANWGANGPARDRFYAFDKQTGDLVWYSTPGGQPKDSSYAPPTLSWWNGQRVFYCGTGDGAIVCANAVSGEPIWRVKISQGGVNTAILVHNNDKLITIHGRENLDTSEIGRMVAVRIPKTLPDGAERPVIFDMKDIELWRNNLSSFSSSPILVGDRVYQVDQTGNLCAVDAQTGRVEWKRELGKEQRNASLIFADGRLYIPFLGDALDTESAETGTKGAFYIIEPSEEGCEILSHVTLDGRCFGSPTVYNGKIYVQTTRKLYCFGRKGRNPGLPPARPEVAWPEPGAPASLQVIPAEVLLAPEERQGFRIRKLDANGLVAGEVEDVSEAEWESYIPPTAKVRVRMNGAFDDEGVLVAGSERLPSAGAYKATLDGLEGFIRGRVLPGAPFSEDFERFEITEIHPDNHPEPGTEYAYPPLPWIGARFKFEVRERDGNKVLTKTIDKKLFQRGIVFIGREDMKDYTIQADVLSDGSRFKMSEVGLINQRYFVILKGNAQSLEVNSNQERIKVSTRYRWKPDTWYRLKTRVDVAPDGSGVVRAKVWPREESEPEPWTLEVPHNIAHASGSPGLFGFAPQEMKVYIDNVSITAND